MKQLTIKKSLFFLPRAM